MRTKRLLAKAAVGVALAGGALASPAYGASKASSSTSNSGEVTFAVASTFSGAESFIGSHSLLGTQVAVAEINKAGGILGHKVRIVTADDAGDPVDAVPAISQLISTKHPVAMIGPSSLTITAVANMINQDHIVQNTLGGTTQLDKMTFPYLFRTSPSDSQEGVAMAYFAIKHKYKNAALVFTSDSSAQTLVAPIIDTLKRHGVNVVTNQKLAPDQTSYRSEVERVIQSKPDVLIVQQDPQTASTFFSEWTQLGGGDTPIIGSDVAASADFVKAISSPVAVKRLTAVEPSTAGGPAADEFNKFYAQVLHGQQPLSNTPNSYDATNIFALAMVAAHSTDPTKYVKFVTKVSNPGGVKVYDYKSGVAALKAGKKINYEGAGGPDDFDKYHNVTGAFAVVKPSASGKFQTVEQIQPNQLFNY